MCFLHVGVNEEFLISNIMTPTPPECYLRMPISEQGRPCHSHLTAVTVLRSLSVNIHASAFIPTGFVDAWFGA